MFNFFKIYKVLNSYYWFIYCFLYDCLNLTLSRLDIERKDLDTKDSIIYYNYSVFVLKNYYYDKFFKNKDFLFIDLIWAKLFSIKYFLKNYDLTLHRAYFRSLNDNRGFYFNFKLLNNNKNFLNYYLSFFYSFYKYFWIAIKYWVFALLIGFLIIYFTLVLKSLPFNKIIFCWIAVIMFGYWLISGFVFFIKKYQFGKYTSAIQRFWRRTYILFWLIEIGTFSVFLFLTINASQESFYMFDQISIFKTHLYSWKLFFLKLFPIAALLIITYIFILSLKWNIFSKHSLWLLILTLFLTYVVWLEFYQFYHVLHFYGNLNWIYDIDDHSWVLEQEPRRTRIVNHYVMLLFILKFWHIVFIYGVWIFFVLRSLEIGRIRYPLLAANFQNFLILYIFAWIFMYPWFKFFFRKFLDSPYYWFYVNNRKLFFRVFFNDLKLIYYGLVDYLNFFNYNWMNKFNINPFFYWKLAEFNNFEMYRKHYLKNLIIKSLNN